MIIESSELQRAMPGVTAARKASEPVSTPGQRQASSGTASDSQTHWMDGVALWVWVFGIGGLALVNLIDLVKALFVR
jgi:hypothetical protein